jgi:SNF2 family DNA or RNA helicase
VHRSAYVLTRKQAGISNEKIYERRVVTLNKEARRAYDKIKKEFVAEWKGREVATKWVPVQYMWLQQISSGFLDKQLVERSKFTELHNLLTGELKSDQVVVWFRFNAGLLEAERVLRDAGIRCGKILGEVKPVDREQAINDFRAGTTRVLLCQIKAAKEAIDLSVSSTAIYFSNSHSLDERVQSEDRILDVKKQEPLLYIDLVTEDTVDEDIVDLLREKKTEARFFLNRLLEKLYGK